MNKKNTNSGRSDGKSSPPAGFEDVEPELLSLAEADLARSGLTLDDAAANGVAVFDEAAVHALGHRTRGAGLVFPYWDPFASDFLPLEQFHRVRYLRHDDSEGGFAAQTERPRYSQPPGTLNAVYVPRTLEGKPYDWQRHLTTVTEPLFITEGEKKAAAACRKGIPTIGLGGVDVFQARKKGADSLPILSQIDFRGRNVGVVFDSDSAAGLKPQVLAAATRLLDWLLARGARPTLITLPGEDGKKIGFDDWLLTHEKVEFSDLVSTSGLPHGDAMLIARAASHYRYIVNIDRFVGDDPQILFQVQHLDRVLGLRQVTMPRLEKLKDNGRTVTRLMPKPVSLAEALLIWPGTENFDGLSYAPGEGREVRRHGQMHLNLWQGWRCEYVGTDRLPSERERQKVMSEWLWAIDNVFADDADARAFVLHWLHYPLRHAGAKLNTFALVSSRAEGIGKSFIGHMLAKYVYGLTADGPRHAWQLSEGDLHGAFNPYLFATSFVEGDDIAAHDKKSVYERIKSFVTSDTVQINIKNNPQFMMDNRANFWFTTNDAAPFYLSENSRRAFIHIPRKAKKDQERYYRLNQMFEAGVAGPAVLHWAREAYDEVGFVPGGDAPVTRGKMELALNARMGAKEWIWDLVQHPEHLTRPYATVREIAALMEIEGVLGNLSSDGIGYQLRDAGAIRWNDGAQIQVPRADGGLRRERVWIFSDYESINAQKAPAVERGMCTPFGFIKSNKVVPIQKARKY